jgi:hypothetical protein
MQSDHLEPVPVVALRMDQNLPTSSSTRRPSLSDTQQRLAKLRDAAADWAMAASEITSKKQRDLFVRIARQLTLRADQIEASMAKEQSGSIPAPEDPRAASTETQTRAEKKRKGTASWAFSRRPSEVFVAFLVAAESSP